jgi:DNA-binding NarL/FixJ family response regulator
VVVIEDHPGLCEGLRLEINRSAGLKCVGAFESLEDGLKFIPKSDVDICLLDLMLPGADGIEGTARLKKKFPRLKVIIFSGLDSAEKILAAFNAGADGYLVKSTPREKLAEAIERVYEGQSAISPIVANELVDYFKRRTALFPHLSPTEKLILDGLEKGSSYKEIADILKMSLNTLKTHVKSILLKTGALSSAQAAWLRRQVV